MNKQDLKDGDRLTLRNGEVWHWEDSEFMDCDYHNDLTEMGDNNYDIVKVERIQAIKCLNTECESKTCYPVLEYKTIWKREEQPKKIEPLQHESYDKNSIHFQTDVINKLNEIIEVINKMVLDD